MPVHLWTVSRAVGEVMRRNSSRAAHNSTESTALLVCVCVCARARALASREHTRWRPLRAGSLQNRKSGQPGQAPVLVLSGSSCGEAGPGSYRALLRACVCRPEPAPIRHRSDRGGCVRSNGAASRGRAAQRTGTCCWRPLGLQSTTSAAHGGKRMRGWASPQILCRWRTHLPPQMAPHARPRRTR